MIMIILLILIIITIIYPNTSKISLYPQLSFPAASHHCSHHPRRMCWPGWMVTGGSPRGCMPRWPLQPTPIPGKQVPSTHRPLQTFFPRPMKNKDGYTTWACGYFSQVMTTPMMTISKMTTVATMIMQMSWWWVDEDISGDQQQLWAAVQRAQARVCQRLEGDRHKVNVPLSSVSFIIKLIWNLWIKLIITTTRRFKGDPNILGYELLNEPWSGDIYRYWDAPSNWVLLQNDKKKRVKFT